MKEAQRERWESYRTDYYIIGKYWNEIQAGIKLHLYSETWKCAPFGNHSGLVCHPALDAVSSLKVMQQSKISLNIMSWHKDGMTERVLNAMLCKSVVVSDRSTALEEKFLEGEDIVLFSLEKRKRKIILRY